ncbi:MAG: D-aminoacyl-tRNA deacylase [Candidatus Pacearchaeota archaeon]
MNFKILASKKDLAALNIAKELSNLHIDVQLLEHHSIYSENIDKQIPGDFYIFVSMHKSEKEFKSLTIHAPGNWHNADFGGNPEKVCPTSAFFLKHIFKILNEKAKDSGYLVSLEVTHHGPYLEKPCCFIEIGSTEQEWIDEKAGKIIAETIKEAIESFDKANGYKYTAAVGIGGPHYCPNFNKVQNGSGYALGHIIPEYALPLTETMLKEAIEKTIEKPRVAILDWKGLGKAEQRKKILKVLEKHAMQIIKTSQIK